MIRVFDVENGDLILGPIEGHEASVQSVVGSIVIPRGPFGLGHDQSTNLEAPTGNTD
jgi:hypothetical protein